MYIKFKIKIIPFNNSIYLYDNTIFKFKLYKLICAYIYEFLAFIFPKKLCIENLSNIC